MNQKLFFVVALLASCANSTVEICDDSIDNDFDGVVDCADNNCSALPSCAGAEDCNTPGDEDGNGQSDCEDTACAIHPLCAPESSCSDGIDNDADGLVDCNDEDCFSSPSCDIGFCGDDAIDEGEECDGSDLGGFDCTSFGFDGGVLSCAPGCFFDLSSCVVFGECGDGLLDAGEECDDGNRTDGDGCSAFCSIELGECGDSFVSFGEQCDDGNNTNGDGCDALCQFENFIEEIEPNEDGTPQPNGDTLTGNDFDPNGAAIQNALSNGFISVSMNISAAFSPAGDEDVFAVTNTSQSSRLFSAETFGEPSLSACPDIDTVISLRNELGEILLLNDDDGQDLCSLASNVQLEPGQILFVHVMAFGDLDEIPQYFLQVRFQ